MNRKESAEKYLQPIFSEKAMISDEPIVTIPKSEIDKANARIAISVRQNQRERGDNGTVSRVCLP